MTKIIRESAHEFLVSEDEWKSFYVLKKATVEATEEVERDTLREVQIRHHLGEKKGKIIINELKEIRKLIKEKAGNGYGLSFEVFCVAVIHDLSYEETIEKYIVHGSRDGQVDAVYWDDDNVYLYQIKFDYLKENCKRKIRANYIEYMENRKIDKDDVEDLEKYLDLHYDEIKDKSYDIITISNNGEFCNYKPLDIMHRFFVNRVLPQKNNIKLRLTIPKDKDSEENISILLSSAKEEVYAFFCNAKYLIDSLVNVPGVNNDENIYKYFYDNVRGFVGVNKQIQSTILNEPENFSKYNNGITITGKVTYDNTLGRITIENPIISNGQQTICNLLNNKDAIDNIDLLIIVKNDGTPSIADKIARYTNTQRNITSVDLLSLDKNIRIIQKEIFDDNVNAEDIFLDINTSGKKNYSKMIKDIYGKYGIISLKDFCKLYYSLDDKKLGSWKSSVSRCVDDLLLNGVDPLKKDKAINVCHVIKGATQFIDSLTVKEDKNNLKSSELAFMYIMYKYKKDVNEAFDIIKHINNKYYYNVINQNKKSKLIDLYKSNNIVKTIETEMALMNSKKVTIDV